MKLRGLLTLSAALIGLVALAQNARPPLQGDDVSYGDGSFSAITTSGDNVLGGQTTLQGHLSGRDAGFHNGSFTGSVGAAGPVTVSGTTSAAAFDGGAAVFATVNTSGRATIGGGITSISASNSFGTATFSTVAQFQGASLNLGATVYCDRRGAAGPITCNNAIGGAATLPAGGAGIQINGNTFGTTSMVMATIGEVDATCYAVASQADAGNVVLLATPAACTNPTDFTWTLRTGP